MEGIRGVFGDDTKGVNERMSNGVFGSGWDYGAGIRVDRCKADLIMGI